MTATIERTRQTVLVESESPQRIGDKYAVTPLGQEFLPFAGHSGLWLAEQPMTPGPMMESIEQWNPDSHGLRHIILPYDGRPTMTQELHDEFASHRITIHPVQVAYRGLNRAKSQNTPDNLITVSPGELGRVTDGYMADNKRYCIDSPACGQPALISVAGLMRIGSQLKGDVAIFGAHRDKPSTAPLRPQMPRANVIRGHNFSA